MSGAGWVFAFPGLQPFDPAAARALEAAWPGTARVLAQCEQAARRAGGVSILAAWRGAHGTAPIVDCRLCYPLNLAYQAALLARLAEAGIEPAAVVGISAGETAAAYSAGMLSLEDAMRVAIHTGAALEEHQKWQRIASLHTSAAHVDALVDEERSQVDVSMIVSDQLTVISGDAGAIERILARARRADIGHTEVGFGFGAHNRRMNAMREPLMHALRGPRPPWAGGSRTRAMRMPSCGGCTRARGSRSSRPSTSSGRRAIAASSRWARGRCSRRRSRSAAPKRFRLSPSRPLRTRDERSVGDRVASTTPAPRGRDG